LVADTWLEDPAIKNDLLECQPGTNVPSLIYF